MNLDPQVLHRLVKVTMPFGKYGGRVIADLPEAYLLWFANKGFPQGELGELMALMLVIQENGLESLLDPLRPKNPNEVRGNNSGSNLL